MLQEEKKRKLQASPAKADGRPGTPADAAADAEPDAVDAGTAAAEGSAAAGASGGPTLPRDEVIRRLRALGQPITLFGEEDADRQVRLRKVEKTVALVDETRGGQQDNVLLMLRRQEKLSKQKGSKAAATDAASKADGPAGGSSKAAGGTDGPVSAADQAAANKAAGTAAGDGAAAAADGSGDKVLKAFQEAAARLAAQRAEEALPVEDRMIQQLQGWCKEWEDDLEARSEEVS